MKFVPKLLEKLTLHCIVNGSRISEVHFNCNETLGNDKGVSARLFGYSIRL